MKVSANFQLKEFIDKKTYSKWGDASIWFIDPKIISIAQFVRERHGKPVTINSWFSGGQYNYSAFDPPGGYRKASSLSQHRFGRAIDLKLLGEENKGADILRDDIINNFDLYRKFGLTTIEDAKYAPTWCHIDCRSTGMDELKIVKP